MASAAADSDNFSGGPVSPFESVPDSSICACDLQAALSDLSLSGLSAATFDMSHDQPDMAHRYY